MGTERDLCPTSYRLTRSVLIPPRVMVFDDPSPILLVPFRSEVRTLAPVGGCDEWLPVRNLPERYSFIRGKVPPRDEWKQDFDTVYEKKHTPVLSGVGW